MFALFRHIQLMRAVRHLSAVLRSHQHCKTVTSVMTKYSRWLRGHDDAPAVRADVPEPEELRGDIDKLDDFLAAIRKRRK